MNTVEEWMGREVVTLEESDDLSRATKILQLGRIRHLPVVRDAGWSGWSPRTKSRRRWPVVR